MSVKEKRQYSSPLRERRASDTRQAVLAAALELFVAHGYVATTIDEIAGRAGVSKPTVFSAVGNKATVLAQVRNVAIAGDDEPTRVPDRPWFREMLAEPNAERTLEMYAHGVAAINQRYADIGDVLYAAAGVDPQLRDLWHAGETERLRGAETIIDNLRTKTALRRERTPAVDVLWVLTAPEQLRRLVRVRGWSLQRFELWLAESFCEQLLRS